jgi:putative transposase
LPAMSAVSIARARSASANRICSLSGHAVHGCVLPGRSVQVISVNDYLARRDAEWMCAIDAVLDDAGIRVVLTGVRMPRMNSIMERWIQTCRRELLDRTLIWNQRHLIQALREFERFYNCHRPHQGIANARPLRPLPSPLADPVHIAHLHIRRHDRLGGTLHEYQHAA